MSEAISILIIVENLPVPLDRRVWQEARALRDAGYEVLVICPRMLGYTKAEEVLEGIRIYRHSMVVEAKGFLGFFLEYASAIWGETRLAWRIWRERRFKIIHLCNPPDLLFAVAWPFKVFGVKVVFDVHDLWPEMYEAKFGGRSSFYWLVRAAQRLNFACADVVLVTNESGRQAAVKHGKKPADRIFVVRTAPKVKAPDIPARPELKRGRSFLVGYVGVMGSADGVHILLRAAAYMVHQRGRRDVQFLLMGSGPEYEDLVQLRDSLGLADWVDMPGWAENDFLFPALRTIDVGVTCDPPNSYNHACTMNKVLEYMVFGKPQVLFDLRESRAAAGDAAWYVQGSTADALAETLLRLLDDPVARQQMGQLAAEKMRIEWTWERSVEELLKGYASALGGASPGREVGRSADFEHETKGDV